MEKAKDTASTTEERHRQAHELELAVATASALPQRPAGPLRFPPFRLLRRR